MIKKFCSDYPSSHLPVQACNCPAKRHPTNPVAKTRLPAGHNTAGRTSGATRPRNGSTSWPARSDGSVPSK